MITLKPILITSCDALKKIVIVEQVASSDELEGLECLRGFKYLCTVFGA